MPGLAFLIGYQLLGMWLQSALHLPLPANVIGLILFTASLFAGLVKLKWVETPAQFLNRHMMLFFTPFVVGTMAFAPYLGQNATAIAAGFIGSTFITLAVAGWLTRLLSARSAKEEGDEHAPS
jgi:holin-like protein